MRRSVPLAIWALTLLASPAPAPSVRADVIYLKDGSKVEGEIVRKTDAGWLVRKTDGKTTNIAADQVKSFEAKRGGNSASPGTAPTDDTMQGLLSLRRALESQSDIAKILERYRKFIEQHMGTPAADEAVKDVAVWEERLEKGMVKVGDKWVTKEEQAVLNEKAVEQAVEARKLLMQGRLKDATAAIDSALTENPHNAAAHYLRGVVLYRQGQAANARKAFDATLHLAPNHGPSLNNIAVINWAAKQYSAALNNYGLSMNAAPGIRRTLDNVAEALNDLPENHRDNAVTKKVVLMFNAQDMALQGRMKKKGLFRWGSTWVSERELKQLKVEEERVEDKLDRLEDEYEQAQERIDQIDRDITDTKRSLNRIEASSFGQDSSGRPVRLAYPKLYYELKRDLEELYSEGDAEKEKISRLKKRAKAAEQELSVPRYAGVQQIVGVDGAPDLPALTEADGEEKVGAASGAERPAAPGQ